MGTVTFKPLTWEHLADHFSIAKTLFGTVQVTKDDSLEWKILLSTPLNETGKRKLKCYPTPFRLKNSAILVAEEIAAKESMEFLKCYAMVTEDAHFPATLS